MHAYICNMHTYIYTCIASIYFGSYEFEDVNEMKNFHFIRVVKTYLKEGTKISWDKKRQWLRNMENRRQWIQQILWILKFHFEQLNIWLINKRPKRQESDSEPLTSNTNQHPLQWDNLRERELTQFESSEIYDLS